MNTIIPSVAAPAPTTPPDGAPRRETPDAVERESVAGEEDPGAGGDVRAQDASATSTRPDPERLEHDSSDPKSPSE